MPTRTAVKPQWREIEIFEDMWGRQFDYMKKFAMTIVAAFTFLTFVELILASFACSQLCAERRYQADINNTIKGQKIGSELNSYIEDNSMHKEDFEGATPSADDVFRGIEYDCEKEPENEELLKELDSRSKLITAEELDGFKITTMPTSQNNSTMIQKLSGFLEHLYEKYSPRYSGVGTEDHLDIGADRVIIVNALFSAQAS